MGIGGRQSAADEGLIGAAAAAAAATAADVVGLALATARSAEPGDGCDRSRVRGTAELAGPLARGPGGPGTAGAPPFGGGPWGGGGHEGGDDIAQRRRRRRNGRRRRRRTREG